MKVTNWMPTAVPALVLLLSAVFSAPSLALPTAPADHWHMVRTMTVDLEYEGQTYPVQIRSVDQLWNGMENMHPVVQTMYDHIERGPDLGLPFAISYRPSMVPLSGGPDPEFGSLGGWEGPVYLLGGAFRDLMVFDCRTNPCVPMSRWRVTDEETAFHYSYKPTITFGRSQPVNIKLYSSLTYEATAQDGTSFTFKLSNLSVSFEPGSADLHPVFELANTLGGAPADYDDLPLYTERSCLRPEIRRDDEAFGECRGRDAINEHQVREKAGFSDAIFGGKNPETLLQNRDWFKDAYDTVVTERQDHAFWWRNIGQLLASYVSRGGDDERAFLASLLPDGVEPRSRAGVSAKLFAQSVVLAWRGEPADRDKADKLLTDAEHIVMTGAYTPRDYEIGSNAVRAIPLLAVYYFRTGSEAAGLAALETCFKINARHGWDAGMSCYDTQAFEKVAIPEAAKARIKEVAQTRACERDKVLCHR